jgi:predicted amidophosphoribosyltransferase
VKFCQECGTPLAAIDPKRCASCGAELAPGTRFCGECGASQLTTNRQDTPTQGGKPYGCV